MILGKVVSNNGTSKLVVFVIALYFLGKIVDGER